MELLSALWWHDHLSSGNTNVRKPEMKKQSGFTLIELMIVVAIVAVLAAIALPAYQKYTAKAKFTEVVSAANPVKQQVELCFFDKQAFTDCDNAASGAGWTIGADTSYGNGNYVNTVTVANGKVTVAPTTKDGFAATQTFELTPSAANGSVVWSVGGGCKAAGLC
jgi:type IV pilus assembly protein PilA